MIPKIIHYCWFGGKPLGEEEKKCIASWKKYFPDYEIKLWNEDNYNVNKIPYIEQAYRERKYAFVSDYARFDILYQYGGIYFDTDVEVIKPMDAIIQNGSYMGCEVSMNHTVAVAAGLGMAVEAGNDFFREVLQYYQKLKFYVSGEQTNQTVVTNVTSLLKKRGLKNTKKIQKVGNIMIYPPEYFCPMNYMTNEIRITENTYTIHHYSASWLSDEERKKNEEIGRLSKYVGKFVAKVIVVYKYEIKERGCISVFGYTFRKIKERMKRKKSLNENLKK